MKKNEIIVQFSIFSDMKNYKEISEYLGVTYDNFCEKGGRMNNASKGAINDSYIWTKESGLNKFDNSLNEHVGSTIKYLEPIKDRLLQLKHEGSEFQLSIIMYGDEINRGVNLDSNVISFLGDISASIDIDIYNI